MKNITQADEAQSSEGSRRIHVLGIGNIGRLFAHSLARISNRPPITLLFHRSSLVQDFKRAGEVIEIITNGTSNKQSGFDYEVVSTEGTQEQSDEPIYNLILATKATQTIPALTRIKHRLTPHSTILLAQNGLSNTSSLTALFPTPSSQPSYLTAVVFHGIYSAGPFTSIHAGVGFLHLAPTSISTVSPDSFHYLLSTVLTLPAVNAIEATASELLIIQLEKLVVNAIINPLTALFRIRNGELYDFPALEPLIRKVIAETSEVILALPELKDEGRGIRERFGVRALAGLVREKALLTRGNKSSMLQDVEEGKGETEIRFINGWVVEKGRELGVGVEVSEKIVKIVEERRVVRLDEVNEVFGL
jgi:2-dehydropantoate 2-reductase